MRRLLPPLLPFLVAASAVLAGCGGDSSSTTEPACCPPSQSQSARTPQTLPRGFTPHRATAVVTGWHLPVATGRQAVVGIGPGQVLLAGGLLAGDSSTARVTRIHLRSGHTSPAPSLAVPVHDTAGGLVAGVPTVVGGGNSTEQSVIQVLDGDRWRVAAHLPTTRSDLSVAELGRSRAFVLGGYDGTATPTAILALSPHGRFRQVGHLASGTRYAATAVLGHTAYLFGGEVLGRELASVQAVDLASGRTRVVAHLPMPLGHAMAATVGSRILLMGGRVSPAAQTAAMWWFDPSTATFSRAGHLPSPVSDAGVAAYRHGVWLLGGEDPAVTARVVFVKVR